MNIDTAELLLKHTPIRYEANNSVREQGDSHQRFASLIHTIHIIHTIKDTR